MTLVKPLRLPLRAPPCCRFCYDETDCGNVDVCRAIAEVYGEPVESTDELAEDEPK